MRDLIRRARSHEPWWAEVWAALGLLAWAAAAVYSGGLRYQPAYMAALEVMPAAAWICAAVLIAAGQLTALARDARMARFYLAGAAAALMLSLGVVTAEDFGVFPTWPIYLLIGLPNLASIVLLRLPRHGT